jgi:hypothetical protein
LGPIRSRRALAIAGCCILAGIGAIVAFAVVGSGSSRKDASLPTTGNYAPLTVWRPPIIRIGAVVMNDPESPPQQWLFTGLRPLSGRNRYQVSLQNTSSVGSINSLQWFPPPGIQVARVLGSSTGHCKVGGVTGFGGNQFKGLLLYPNIVCDSLNLKPPTCTCKGDGGSITISFVLDRPTTSPGGSRVLTATPVLKAIPSYIKS